jgi:hypothetical protein
VVHDELKVTAILKSKRYRSWLACNRAVSLKCAPGASQRFERPRAGNFLSNHQLVRGKIKAKPCRAGRRLLRRKSMHGIIYLVGLIVVIMFILSLLGLR